MSFSIEEGLCGVVLRTRETLVSAMYSEEPKQLSVDQAAETGPAVLVPLQSEEDLLGVMAVFRRRGPETQPFTAEEVR
jgi:putative methionine-R-sulfoxide reductase with GAF domain